MGRFSHDFVQREEARTEDVNFDPEFPEQMPAKQTTGYPRIQFVFDWQSLNSMAISTDYYGRIVLCGVVVLIVRHIWSCPTLAS